MRICSLLPSATEIVCALGLGGELVGVSEECDWPPEVGSLPRVSASRIDTRALSGREIDDAVRAALADGRTLYALDEELLRRLEPDLILTQDLCEVCAVSSQDVHIVGAEVVSLEASTIAELERAILDLAGRLGAAERGRAVVDRMRARLAEIEAAVAGAPRRRVVVLEWLDPPYAAGHWVPEMVALAGGEELLGRAGERSFRTSWDDVAAAAPELIVVAPCGYDAERGSAEARRVGDRLKAVPRVVAVDANAYFSRAAPRLPEGVAQLAHLFHPGRTPNPGLPFVSL